MLEFVIKRFDSPDEIREFPKGRFEVVRVGTLAIGRATYEPGWRWSEHVGAATATALCMTPHVGMVVSGRAAVSWPNGTIDEMSAGDLFSIAPGHDSWVIGDEPYVSLHFSGADDYARSH